MLARGAFAEARGVKAAGALYLKLGGAKGGEIARAQLQGRQLRRCRRQAFRRTHAAARTIRQAGDALSVAALSEIRRGASATTTISRASRNGRRPAARKRRAEARRERAAGAARNSARRRRARRRAPPIPRASAWVSANAGSGKTHVLVQRVLRLLLDGAPPSRILCLTFTKAAAANMAERVFKTLAQMDAARRRGACAPAIVEAGAPAPDAARLDFARRLFARTIETPGGLKIQTIHAFCERLLHLFPFEANVAAGFRVVEEREAALLLERARREALARGAARAGGASRARGDGARGGRRRLRQIAARSARPARRNRRSSGLLRRRRRLSRALGRAARPRAGRGCRRRSKREMLRRPGRARQLGQYR